jgi:hypothetical protein
MVKREATARLLLTQYLTHLLVPLLRKEGLGLVDSLHDPSLSRKGWINNVSNATTTPACGHPSLKIRRGARN